jgi:hypothetical protein
MPFVELTELLHLPNLTKETGAQDDQHVKASEEYVKVMGQSTVGVNPEDKYVAKLQYLVGEPHVDPDDGLLYKTTRVVVRRGLMIGFRALITAGKQQIEDKTTVHIADIKEMSELFARQQLAQQRNQDAGTSDVPSTVSTTPLLVDEPEVPSGVEPPSPLLERSVGKRVVKRPSYLGMTPLKWLKEAPPQEPQTHKESRECPEYCVFAPCVLELCLYYMMYKGESMYWASYVDNIIIISCCNVDFITKVNAMCARVGITDEGEMEHSLIVSVTRTIFSSEDLDYDEKQYFANFLLRSLMEALLYLRPDIAYAVGVLSRFGRKPTRGACTLVIYCLRCLRDAVAKGIRFSASSVNMHIFTDTNWASDQITWKSTTGCFFCCRWSHQLAVGVPVPLRGYAGDCMASGGVIREKSDY